MRSKATYTLSESRGGTSWWRQAWRQAASLPWAACRALFLAPSALFLVPCSLFLAACGMFDSGDPEVSLLSNEEKIERILWCAIGQGDDRLNQLSVDSIVLYQLKGEKGKNGLVPGVEVSMLYTPADLRHDVYVEHANADTLLFKLEDSHASDPGLTIRAEHITKRGNVVLKLPEELLYNDHTFALLEMSYISKELLPGDANYDEEAYSIDYKTGTVSYTQQGVIRTNEIQDDGRLLLHNPQQIRFALTTLPTFAPADLLAQLPTNREEANNAAPVIAKLYKWCAAAIQGYDNLSDNKRQTEVRNLINRSKLRLHISINYPNRQMPDNHKQYDLGTLLRLLSDEEIDNLRREYPDFDFDQYLDHDNEATSQGSSDPFAPLSAGESAYKAARTACAAPDRRLRYQ